MGKKFLRTTAVLVIVVATSVGPWTLTPIVAMDFIDSRIANLESEIEAHAYHTYRDPVSSCLLTTTSSTICDECCSKRRRVRDLRFEKEHGISKQDYNRQQKEAELKLEQEAVAARRDAIAAQRLRNPRTYLLRENCDLL